MNSEQLIQQVLQSAFFKKAGKKARSYVGNFDQLGTLIGQVIDKTSQVSDGKGLYGNFMQQVATLVRMLKAYRQGTYNELPLRSILLIIATLLYFISPLDLIPDILPIIGISDDITLVLWTMSSLKSDIDKFKEWEHTHLPVS